MGFNCALMIVPKGGNAGLNINDIYNSSRRNKHTLLRVK